MTARPESTLTAPEALLAAKRAALIETHCEALPAELRERPAWVCWQLELRRDRDGEQRVTKVPKRADNGRNASSTNPATWCAFETALAGRDRHGFDGIGFVFGDGDPYFGVDVDSCCDPLTGEIAAGAAALMQKFATYAELSCSGAGLHLICRGELPENKGRRVKRVGFELEVYPRGRYFAMTGERAGDAAEVSDCQAQLDDLLAGDEDKETPLPAPRAPLRGLNGDEELIRKAMDARNGDKFTRLWYGDASDYGSHSEADLALCTMLAWWAGGDRGQVDRIFRMSSLYRQKWEREDYSGVTLDRALSTAAASPRTHGGESAPAPAPNQAAADPEPLPAPAPDGKPAKIQHLTDVGNGQRFAAMHAGKVVYMPSRGWLAYDSATGAWRPNERAAARLAKATALSWYATAAECEDSDMRTPVLKHARASEAAQKIAATLKMAESELALEADPKDFDAHPLLLNTPNCVVDLRSGERLPHDPELRFTQVAGASYEPGAECPLWLAHLKRIFAGDAELIGFLQRFFGYCLTGRTGEQIVCIFYGNGQNGKTVTVETARAVEGDYAGNVDPKSLAVSKKDGPRSDLARLAGARLVTASENTASTQLDEALVKAVTGGEPLTVRFMYKDLFEYVPQFKVVLLTNHKPEIQGTDLGIWRRVRLVPFGVTIPEAERREHDEMLEAFRAELPGILNWMVEGCVAWQEKGLEAPAAVLEATASYRSEMDVEGRFLSEMCTPDQNASVPVHLMYQTYRSWAEHAGETPITEQQFRTALREHKVCLEGLEPTTKRLLCWGIRLSTSRASRVTGGNLP